MVCPITQGDHKKLCTNRSAAKIRIDLNTAQLDRNTYHFDYTSFFYESIAQVIHLHVDMTNDENKVFTTGVLFMSYTNEF